MAGRCSNGMHAARAAATIALRLPQEVRGTPVRPVQGPRDGAGYRSVVHPILEHGDAQFLQGLLVLVLGQQVLLNPVLARDVVLQVHVVQVMHFFSDPDRQQPVRGRDLLQLHQEGTQQVRPT
ncbi:hypothetical protein GCM10008955_38810 [Deinococcus malanensis]|uniref:Uncharacterized protein n=1 Tax=Deinococcus malanensis TaxID=1706855 RepID=A0ABQ2F297_9DEIO|nr:hypothetical protein [Deinococcus malanensis]GGK41211.1 hypothetical protein GCM10008955_38810 [Deinococcus malanensis]